MIKCGTCSRGLYAYRPPEPRRSSCGDRARPARRRCFARRLQRAQDQARRRKPPRRSRASLRAVRPDRTRDRARLRPRPDAESRLPAADLHVGAGTTVARCVCRGLPQGGDRCGRARPHLACVLTVSRRGRAVGRRSGQLLEHRAGLRCVESHGEVLLRDPRGHPARTLASGVHQASQTTRHRRAEVLLLGCRRREPAVPARNAPARWRAVR